MATIVVIDDDQTLRALFATMLERRGHTVVTAASVTEARASLAMLPPDVVAVDMHMPQGGGAELIRALRATVRSPRIVAMSGDVTALAAAAAAGADVTLDKPFSFGEFVAAIEASRG